MHAAAHAERSCVKGRPEAVDGVQNPNPRPDPQIFLKIRPNPSTYKILRSVTTLQMSTYVNPAGRLVSSTKMAIHMASRVYGIVQDYMIMLCSVYPDQNCPKCIFTSYFLRITSTLVPGHFGLWSL